MDDGLWPLFQAGGGGDTETEDHTSQYNSLLYCNGYTSHHVCDRSTECSDWK